MTIKTISYARLFKTVQFENERIEITAELKEGEDVDEVFADLKRRVLEKSSRHSKLRAEAERVLRNKKRELTDKVQWAKQVIEGTCVVDYDEYDEDECSLEDYGQ